MTERKPYERSGRCVHCSQLRVMPGEPCRYSKTGHETSDLPEGKSCGQCFAFARFCQPVIGRIAADQSCDYSPVRFAEIATPTAEVTR